MNPRTLAKNAWQITEELREDVDADDVSGKKGEIGRAAASDIEHNLRGTCKPFEEPADGRRSFGLVRGERLR
jgi:hypothetical protein